MWDLRSLIYSKKSGQPFLDTKVSLVAQTMPIGQSEEADGQL